MGKFTAEEIQIAKAVDLVDLAEQIGIPLKRKGRFYQAVGMDSVMIFNRSSWCRFSQGVGGSTIDFLEYFRNMDCVEAVKYLLEFAGYIRTETMQKFQPERQAEKIEEIGNLAKKHGFKLAGFRSFDRSIGEEEIKKIYSHVRGER